jgi:hypothetical protein
MLFFAHLLARKSFSKLSAILETSPDNGTGIDHTWLQLTTASPNTTVMATSSHPLSLYFLGVAGKGFVYIGYREGGENERPANFPRSRLVI